MKVDLIQNSAISFSVCVFDSSAQEELLHELRGRFQVDHKQMFLYTIRHFQPESAAFLLRKHELLLEQYPRNDAVGYALVPLESVLLHKRKCKVFDFFSCCSKSSFDFFFIFWTPVWSVKLWWIRSAVSLEYRTVFMCMITNSQYIVKRDVEVFIHVVRCVFRNINSIFLHRCYGSRIYAMCFDTSWIHI